MTDNKTLAPLIDPASEESAKDLARLIAGIAGNDKTASKLVTEVVGTLAHNDFPGYAKVMLSFVTEALSHQLTDAVAGIKHCAVGGLVHVDAAPHEIQKSTVSSNVLIAKDSANSREK